MRRITSHPEADEELVAAAAYINSRRPGHGDEFLAETGWALAQLSRDPTLWKVRKYGYRRYVLTRFGYLIWYKERKDDIYIIAVHHGSRRPGYWKERISDEQR